MVLGVLRQECQTTLDQIRQVKQLVSILNRAISEVENGLVDELNRLVALIPDPPLFDLRELANIVTCPLTPQSIFTEFVGDATMRSEQEVSGTPFPARFPAQLSAFFVALNKETIYTTTAYRGVTGILLALAAQVDAVINRIYEIRDYFLSTSSLRWILEILFRFADEIDRVLDSAATFTIRLSMTSANAALVRNVCPSLYADDTLPYKAFVQEMSTFSYDGFLPGGIKSTLQPFLPPLVAFQSKVAGWQTAQFLLLA